MKPGQELIRELEKLRVILDKIHSSLDNSGVQRTAHFLNYVGTNCTYYRKSLDLFLEEDYDRIKNQVMECADFFTLLEGPSE